MSDIIIDNLTIFEFELTEHLSLFFDRVNDIWYVENFNTVEEDNVLIIEDEDFSLEDEEIDAFGFTLTREMLEEYKDIIKYELEEEEEDDE